MKRAAAACLLLVIAGSCTTRAEPYFILATTTSVGNSGLLDTLLPAFQQRTGVNVRVHLAGSGRALAMLTDGQADAVISHAPEAEVRALAQHPQWWYRKIMFNDFVLVGPEDDPAGVRSADSTKDAMRRIARSHVLFLSRGDESGTHERERTLWRQAGVAPDPERVLVTVASMAQTLRVASEQSAYTLTDRATYAALQPQLAIAVVYEGAPELLNTYAIIVNPQTQSGQSAMKFAMWLVDGDGRALVGSFKTRDLVQAFHPWPTGRPRERPGDTPR